MNSTTLSTLSTFQPLVIAIIVLLQSGVAESLAPKGRRATEAGRSVGGGLWVMGSSCPSDSLEKPGHVGPALSTVWRPPSLLGGEHKQGRRSTALEETDTTQSRYHHQGHDTTPQASSQA
jgi:hypothetical protein